MDKYPERIVYDAALNFHAKVSAIIRGPDWDWPVSHSIYLDDVRPILSNFPRPTGTLDTMRWNVTPNGAFKTSLIWNHLRDHHPIVPWYHIV